VKPAAPRGLAADGDTALDVERRAYQERLEVFLASREAGMSLTREALSDGLTLRAIIDVAARLAVYADEAQVVVRDEYRPRLHCRDACWYCCCKPNVLVSVPELARILDYVERTFTSVALSALRDRARAYSTQMAGRPLDEPVNESVPCPLLVDGRCSVYEVRPLVCRGYNSTDVDACRKAHTDATALVPIFALLKDVTDGATVGAGQSLEAATFNDAVIDLGSALNIALSRERDFAGSIVRAETDLLPTENPTYLAELWAHVCETARSVGTRIGARGAK
jgi:Fe-S-cluster containining protein